MSRSLTLSSASLGVIAKLDVAEAEDGRVTPIDYSRRAGHVPVRCAQPPAAGRSGERHALSLAYAMLTRLHVLLLEIGAADKIELAITSIGRTFSKVERRATVI